MKRSWFAVTFALALFAGAAQPALAAPAEPPGPWTDQPIVLCIIGYHLPQHPVFAWWMNQCVKDAQGPH